MSVPPPPPPPPPPPTVALPRLASAPSTSPPPPTFGGVQLPPLPTGGVTLRPLQPRATQPIVAKPKTQSELAADIAKERAAREKCPLLEGDQPLIDRYQKFVLRRDSNAKYLEQKGYNPVDIALLTKEERKELVTRIKTDPSSEKLQCFSLSERQKATERKQFGFELSDTCYPAELDEATYKTIEACEKEKLVNAVSGNITKYIDLAWPSPTSAENITAFEAFQKLDTDAKLKLWEDLRATGILDLKRVEKTPTYELPPAIKKQIADWQEQLKQPGLNPIERKNIQNKIETASTKREKLEIVSTSPDIKRQAAVAKSFFASRLLGAEPETGQSLGTAESERLLQQQIEQLQRQIANLRTELTNRDQLIAQLKTESSQVTSLAPVVISPVIPSPVNVPSQQTSPQSGSTVSQDIANLVQSILKEPGQIDTLADRNSLLELYETIGRALNLEPQTTSGPVYSFRFNPKTQAGNVPQYFSVQPTPIRDFSIGL